MTKFKHILQKSVLIFFLLYAIFSGLKIIQHKNSYDGIGDMFFHTLFFFADSTEWAPNYSEEAFKKIQKGFSKEEVLEKLGQPVKEEIYSSKEIWRYSTAPPDSNYWFRIVVFDNDNGTVKYTIRKYFVD